MKTKLAAAMVIAALLVLTFGVTDAIAEYPEDGRPTYEPDPGIEEKPDLPFSPEDGWMDDKRRGYIVTEPPPQYLWNFPPP